MPLIQRTVEQLHRLETLLWDGEVDGALLVLTVADFQAHCHNESLN
jgi:hypothetical protein